MRQHDLAGFVPQGNGFVRLVTANGVMRGPGKSHIKVADDIADFVLFRQGGARQDHFRYAILSPVALNDGVQGMVQIIHANRRLVPVRDEIRIGTACIATKYDFTSQIIIWTLSPTALSTFPMPPLRLFLVYSDAA